MADNENTAVRGRMREIIDKLHRASEAYYNDDEVMSNFEYDHLYDTLVELEDTSGIILSDSPTQGVGAEAPDKLEKRRHEYPALSLDKTKDIDKYTAFFREHEAASAYAGCPAEELGETLMWKCDGSTLQLTYEGGKLVSALTRGNGEVGSVIDHNAPYIHGIPQEIGFTGKLVVRGEGVMSYAEFDRINDELPVEEQYKNARNLANATITLLDSREMRRRRIDFFAFKLVAALADELPVNTHAFGVSLDWLAQLGFQVVPHETVTADTLAERMRQWEQSVPDFAFPVDGLVTALNNTAYAEAQPGTGHNPHKTVGYAFKWADETEQTVLREIEWSASRTGLLNPVAIFDSVELEGTTVSRATLHNVSFVLDMDLKTGDRITIYKANKIIPNLAENLDRVSVPYDAEPSAERLQRSGVPCVCPVCGGKVSVRQNSEGSGTLVALCLDGACPAKKIGSFAHFCERNSMNIIGMSEKTIERFVNAGILREYADFWQLGQHREEIVAMDGLGERAADNIQAAVNGAANTDFVRFVNSLGVPHIGRGQARLLRQYLLASYNRDREDISLFEALITLIDSGFDFALIDGFGDKRAAELTAFFTPALRADVLSHGADTWLGRLLACVRFEDEWQAAAAAADEADNPVAGKTFVITGSLEHFKNRAELQAKIEELGGKVSGSVSAKTNYLINNDVTSTTGKNQKAQALGIPILSEEDFLALLQ